MQTELEVKFSNVNHDELREKIKILGGKCIKEKTLMKRIIFFNKERPDFEYFRIRDEGDKITASYKKVDSGEKNISSVKEVEIEVDNFENNKKILELAGLIQKSYQESYREIWQIGETYFMLDIWPGLKPFIEIESSSEENIKYFSEKLGFDYKDGIFGTLDELAFKETGILPEVINILPEITFANPPKFSEIGK